MKSWKISDIYQAFDLLHTLQNNQYLPAEIYWKQKRDCSLPLPSVWLSSFVIFKRNGKGKVVPLLKQALRREDVLGEWRYSSTHS
jgi:hypothetical protein